MKKPKQLFVIRKYVMASDINEALRLDAKTRPQEVWVDEDWRKNHAEDAGGKMGFDKT